MSLYTAPSGLREVSQLLFLSAAHDIPSPSLRDAGTGGTASWQDHASQLQPQERRGPCGSLSVSVKAGAGWQVPPAPHSSCSCKQRQQLAKAQTAELGAFNRDQMHGESSVFRDSPSSLEPCVPSQGPHPELGCWLYLHLPRQQQEEVEQLLEASGEPDAGWRGLAGHLGYQAEAVETMAQSQAPAYTLLRYWAVQEGSGASLKGASRCAGCPGP
ncbi:death domain-containing membrane protein NRADD-like isoform X2 [Kogia breviceps]|uniref:death domain-containing membrane protein NRADD-like isoform X2 n=1 Tax=Kogia breviceps TaxID=27615 RepID=UPI0034D1CA8B